jgi:hypothetical protein
MSAADPAKSGTFKGLKLTNTLTRQKEDFCAIDDSNVRLYVCGPTVYDFAHIGNARPAIVFDVLYRLLRHLYGAEHVTYARNITDVDDKINARALRDYPDMPLNEAIALVTKKTADQYHKDVAALGCLEPTVQPRATEHIDGMIKMIEQLIEKGHAYVAETPEAVKCFSIRCPCRITAVFPSASWMSRSPVPGSRSTATRKTRAISCFGNCRPRKSPAGTAPGGAGDRAGTSSAPS